MSYDIENGFTITINGTTVKGSDLLVLDLGELHQYLLKHDVDSNAFVPFERVRFSYPLDTWQPIMSIQEFQRYVNKGCLIYDYAIDLNDRYGYQHASAILASLEYCNGLSLSSIHSYIERMSDSYIGTYANEDDVFTNLSVNEIPDFSVETNAGHISFSRFSPDEYTVHKNSDGTHVFLTDDINRSQLIGTIPGATNLLNEKVSHLLDTITENLTALTDEDNFDNFILDVISDSVDYFSYSDDKIVLYEPFHELQRISKYPGILIAELSNTTIVTSTSTDKLSGIRGCSSRINLVEHGDVLYIFAYQHLIDHGRQLLWVTKHIPRDLITLAQDICDKLQSASKALPLHEDSKYESFEECPSDRYDY